ncbi:unnamed protein product [Discosporangium mesarthrocarpum]
MGSMHGRCVGHRPGNVALGHGGSGRLWALAAHGTDGRVWGVGVGEVRGSGGVRLVGAPVAGSIPISSAAPMQPRCSVCGAPPAARGEVAVGALGCSAVAHACPACSCLCGGIYGVGGTSIVRPDKVVVPPGLRMRSGASGSMQACLWSSCYLSVYLLTVQAVFVFARPCILYYYAMGSSVPLGSSQEGKRPWMQLYVAQSLWRVSP